MLAGLLAPSAISAVDVETKFGITTCQKAVQHGKRVSAVCFENITPTLCSIAFRG
jgi:hypothetical protein